VAPDFSGEIKLVGRTNASGTHAYFKERICGEDAAGKGREYKSGIQEYTGSTAVVELVSTTKTAVGYSGMGYKTDAVNWLSVSEKEGDPPYEPSVQNVVDKKYPIARALYLFTIGEPTGDVKEFIDWVKSEAGQKIVVGEGFVPIN
jgi:phosphate transport system substrate-binding protein